MHEVDRRWLGSRRGRMLAWLELVNAWIAHHPAWFVAVFVGLYGMGITDAAEFRQLANHPLTLYPDPAWQFLHSSPLPYFVGFPIARLVSPQIAFCVVTAAELAVLGWAFVRLIRRMTPDGARTFSLVLMSAPLVLVLTAWIGKSDPAIVGLYLLIVSAPRSRWARVVLALAIVLCHREIGSFVVVGHLVLHRRGRGLDRAVLAGFVLGHLVLLGYLHLVLPVTPVTRIGFAHGHAAILAGGLAANPLAHLMFSLGWFWMFFAIQIRRGGRLLSIAVVAAIVVAAALTFDSTRVSVLCALPVIVDVALALAADPGSLPRFLRRLPFPLVFLLQFQIEGAYQVRDSGWLDAPAQSRCEPPARGG